MPIFKDEIENRIWTPNKKINFSQEIKISFGVIKQLKHRTKFIPNIIYDIRGYLIIKKTESTRILSLPYNDSLEEYEEYSLKISETIKINGKHRLDNHFLVVLPYENVAYIITYKEFEKIWKNKTILDFLEYLLLYKYR